MDFVIVYQNKDDVSPSDFPKGSRLEAEHRLDVVGEPLGTVTPAHAHGLQPSTNTKKRMAMPGL
jgi:hypothetical protein